jgi:hypothetical protein
MCTGKGHVSDEGVRARGLQQSIASAEIEEQPFQRQRGNDFPRIGDKIACGHQVFRGRQRRVLETPDRLQRKLRKISALHKSLSGGGCTRDLPRGSRIGVGPLCKIHKCGKIVAFVRDCRFCIFHHGSSLRGRVWDDPRSLGAGGCLR